MFAETIRLKNNTSEVLFKLSAGEPFFELNGVRITPTWRRTSEGIVVSEDFSRGDVVGAYIKLAINQPDLFEEANKAEVVSKMIARLKQVQLFTVGQTVGVFSLFTSAENIVAKYADNNRGKILLYPIFTEIDPLLDAYLITENPELAETNIEVDFGYWLLSCSPPNGEILNLIDDPQNVNFSDIAIESYKYSNFQIFRYKSKAAFSVGGIYKTPYDYFEVKVGGKVLKIAKNPNVALDYNSIEITPMINPRYTFRESGGIVDDQNYLVGFGFEGGAEEIKLYQGQLPTFEIPINDGSAKFQVKVYTKSQWEYGGIYPANPELAEWIVGSGEWTVSQVKKTDYFETTYELPNLSLTKAQKYIWRLDA